MTSVLVKMADVNARYFKVKLNLFEHWQEKESNISLWIGQRNLSLRSLFGITRLRIVGQNYLSFPQTCDRFLNHSIYEPRREKTGLRDFRPGPTQSGLYSHRMWLVA